MLSSGTIGQHIRHILEFYIAVVEARDTCIINYDNRQRDLLLETDVSCAISNIDKICECLRTMNIKSVLVLTGDYSIESKRSIQVVTTVERELIYNLEHSIHHQALIKVALIDFDLSDIIEEGFGIAPSTIRYKKITTQ
jgi:hypothetical protein